MAPKRKLVIADDTRAKAQARIDAGNALAERYPWKRLADMARKIVKRAVLGASKPDLAPNRLGLTPFELLLVERLSDVFLRALMSDTIREVAKSSGKKPRVPVLTTATYADVCKAYDDLMMTAARNEIHASAWKIAGKALAAARKKSWA